MVASQVRALIGFLCFCPTLQIGVSPHEVPADDSTRRRLMPHTFSNLDAQGLCRDRGGRRLGWQAWDLGGELGERWASPLGAAHELSLLPSRPPAALLLRAFLTLLRWVQVSTEGLLRQAGHCGAELHTQPC